MRKSGMECARENGSQSANPGRNNAADGYF